MPPSRIVKAVDVFKNGYLFLASPVVDNQVVGDEVELATEQVDPSLADLATPLNKRPEQSETVYEIGRQRMMMTFRLKRQKRLDVGPGNFEGLRHSVEWHKALM